MVVITPAIVSASDSMKLKQPSKAALGVLALFDKESIQIPPIDNKIIPIIKTTYRPLLVELFLDLRGVLFFESSSFPSSLNE